MTIFNSERVENVCNFFYLYNYAKENVRKAKNPIQGVKKKWGKNLIEQIYVGENFVMVLKCA